MEKILIKANRRIYCRYCKKVFEYVWICRVNSVIGKRNLLICQGCQKIIAHSSDREKIFSMNLSNESEESVKLTETG